MAMPAHNAPSKTTKQRENETLPEDTMPDDDMPEDMDAFRLQLVRSIADFMGQHERCGFPACRRAKRCMGDPPDCFRNEPPLTAEDEARAKAEIGRALKQHLRDA